MLSQLEEIKDTLFKYFETRIDLFKIETRDKIERAVVMALYGAILLCIALTVLILIVILLGTFLNKWLDSDYLGYLILLGVFVLKLVIWIVFREKLIQFIRGIIVRFVKVKED
ncbi:phage holin family protein [Dyadobacter fanqingshengii]|uniref:Phage holin family protein n=1 Tax=Dyadobacter fanqingshengii TaxID=2906443 RepID=A0A9X1P7S1_9BACT|nr:phage holin family protein [Dyadobacter fanqingshengii]MCF0038753.1 phage holin family protein [Dyadobacter fanqingshengii]MCF2503702.1 phage holin family protein [Dyadobacter fanqingshengii]USJ34417.1 phage holin family protein [Dyadobacter fanqingshengii]